MVSKVLKVQKTLNKPLNNYKILLYVGKKDVANIVGNRNSIKQV